MTDKFMRWFLHPVAYAVWLKMGDPDFWMPVMPGDYHLVSKNNSKVSLWIGNGAWFIKLEAPSTYSFGVLDKHILWRRFEKLRSHQRKQQEGQAIAKILGLLDG